MVRKEYGDNRENKARIRKTEMKKQNLVISKLYQLWMSSEPHNPTEIADIILGWKYFHLVGS